MTLPPQHIKDYCVRWLNPRVRLIRSRDPWAQLRSDCAKIKADWPLVADLIQRLDYSTNFVNTAYWRVIASEVKHWAAFTCQQCGRKDCPLEVHHTTYEHHGSEHLYMADLQAWCVVCHNLHHGEVMAAILAEHAWERSRSTQNDFLKDWELYEDGFAGLQDDAPAKD